MGLFIPTYFSPIVQYGALFSCDEIIFEIHDNFQKQSYRNRCYIYGPNGKQLLSIPVSHPNKEIKKTKDTVIEFGSGWQNQHLKSLKTAYNSSPFFEFYIDELLPILTKQYKYLLDVNIDTFTAINGALELGKPYSTTSDYIEDYDQDFRYLANAKNKEKLNLKRYIQVFEEKSGFLENLSILDLLFMEGPNSLSFLEKIV